MVLNLLCISGGFWLLIALVLLSPLLLLIGGSSASVKSFCKFAVSKKTR